MSRNIIFITIVFSLIFSAIPARAHDRMASMKTETILDGKFAINDWLIRDDTSQWTAGETEQVARSVRETIQALDAIGLDGTRLLDGYRFRRWQGEFAKDRPGKIALVNHSEREIVLSDTILQPEYEFFILHELGHVVNHRSGDRLSEEFHGRVGRIDGISIRHDWTTAEGFWFRGQAHIHRSEATADAFALWVWSEQGRETPTFHDTPEMVQWDAIIEVLVEALENVR